MSGDADIEALIARTQQQRPSQYCWAYYMDGDPARFLKRYIEIYEENPHGTNNSEARRILEEEWEIKVSREQFNRHVRGDCVTCNS